MFGPGKRQIVQLRQGLQVLADFDSIIEMLRARYPAEESVEDTAEAEDGSP